MQPGHELHTLWVCVPLSLGVALVFCHKCDHARGQVLYLFYVSLLMVYLWLYLCNGFEITFVSEKHVVEDDVLFTNHLVGK